MTIKHQATLVAWPSDELAAQAAQYAYFQQYGLFPLVWRQPHQWGWPVIVPASTLQHERYVYWASDRTVESA